MSVLAEGFSVIVRRSTIASGFPGGLVAYERLVPNKTFCADQHLTRVGFLDWPEVSRFLEQLHAVGLSHHYVDGRVDIGLVQQDQGIAGLTPWLEWGRDEAGHSIAWLSGTEVGRLAVPEGWSQDSALLFISNAEAAERLIPLENTSSHSAFLDSGTGQVVYGPNDEAAALRQLDTISQLADQLRFIRERISQIYGYYFPKSFLVPIARAFGLSPQPDFARHAAELLLLRESAARIASEGKSAFEAIANASIDSEKKEGARLVYLQIHYDTNVVVLFDQCVTAMREGDREASRYFDTMLAFTQKANANLIELQKEAARLNRNQP